ncbi:glycosyltransferase family 2 protein [Snuella lapsa]|uniref:Glycosyltransferase 2-like domain-containing protein n=1 Tax=Snuella lapsa TaxID=870481 RepID=A0ABP6XUF4_9FLAO
MELPLVSVCIPTFNGERFVSEAMDSVVNQTYPNLEIVVSDDASDDLTLERIEAFKEKTDIPIIIHNHVPSGIGSNWNNCINKAQGKYIKFLFQDDVLKPECIAEMVALIELDSSIDLVASKREFIIEDSFLTEEIKNWIEVFQDLQQTLGLKKEAVSILDKSLFKSPEFMEIPYNKIGEPSVVLFRKDLISRIGYFDAELRQVLDYEFFYRILKKGKIAIINKELVCFRLHPLQATNLNKGKVSSDYVKLNRIIYTDYFWYLNNTKKIKLLKKYNLLVKFMVRLKRCLRL